MNSYEEDLQYERKMDRIFEDIMLDAMIAALQKIRERNLLKIGKSASVRSVPFLNSIRGRSL